MRRRLSVTAAGIVLWLVGCGALNEAWETTSESTTVQAPEPSAPGNSAADQTSATVDPGLQTVAPVSPPGEDSFAGPSGARPTGTETASAPAAGTSSARTDLVGLSAGTALPQSLPTGTTMSFSVDYTLRKQPAGSLVQYFWVIQRTTGPAVSIPVQLKARGNLVKLVPGWRPEHGPFRGYIAVRTASGQIQQISRMVPLS